MAADRLVRRRRRRDCARDAGWSDLFQFRASNTYYAKDLSFGRAFSYGLGYLISPIYGAAPATFPHALAAFVLVVELGFFALGVVGIVKLAPRCSYLAAIVVAQVLYILRSGGDWMPGGRFLAVGILPLTIVEILGLVFVASRLRTHFTRSHANRFLLALAAICIIVASFSRSHRFGPLSGRWVASATQRSWLLRPTSHSHRGLRSGKIFPRSSAASTPGNSLQRAKSAIWDSSGWAFRSWIFED